MEAKHFSAVTPFEMAQYMPENLAYMGCHFSHSGPGLTNFPTNLPPGSLLLVDDSIPILDHDPVFATKQLLETVEKFSISAVLLDFQKPPTDKSKEMAATIIRALPCLCAITASYTSYFNCPVFLPPPPLTAVVSDYLKPWLERGIFLELADETLQLTVTADGCTASTFMDPNFHPQHYDERLFCHYRVDVTSNSVIFSLHRTKEALDQLSQAAITMGALGTVGLYQELGK